MFGLWPRPTSPKRDKTAYPRRRPVPGEDDFTIGYGRYPINMDAGEHFMRLRTGIDYFPRPPIVGAMSSFMAQRDVAVWAAMFRRPPTGPGTTEKVVNLQFQLKVPGLNKSA